MLIPLYLSYVLKTVYSWYWSSCCFIQREDVCPAPGRCQNLMGSFICDCPEGFTLSRDRMSCIGKYSYSEFNGNLILCSIMFNRKWQRGVYCLSHCCRCGWVQNCGGHLWEWWLHQPAGNFPVYLSPRLWNQPRWNQMCWLPSGRMLRDIWAGQVLADFVF